MLRSKSELEWRHLKAHSPDQLVAKLRMCPPHPQLEVACMRESTTASPLCTLRERGLNGRLNGRFDSREFSIFCIFFWENTFWLEYGVPDGVNLMPPFQSPLFSESPAPNGPITPKRRPNKIPAKLYGSLGREFAEFVRNSYKFRTQFVRIWHIRTNFVQMSRALPANFTRIPRFVRNLYEICAKFVPTSYELRTNFHKGQISAKTQPNLCEFVHV